MTLKPAAFSARTADSRPGPGPLTLTSKFLRPNSFTIFPTRSAATCAANGVLLRDPRKPEPPDVAHANAKNYDNFESNRNVINTPEAMIRLGDRNRWGFLT